MVLVNIIQRQLDELDSLKKETSYGKSQAFVYIFIISASFKDIYTL